MNFEVINKFRELYETTPAKYVTSPGRVDLMGSHTDYNHGFVVTMPINLEIECAYMANDSGLISLYSCNMDSLVLIDASSGAMIEGDDWGKYPSAVARVLLDEGYRLRGFSSSFCSSIPVGSGLSSSAALEATVMAILADASGFELDKLQMSLLCQKAENVYVGVNCGILDQYSIVFGERQKVIKLDCHELAHEQLNWPDELMVAICNTNKPRQLHGSEYDDRRAQCEEAVAEFSNMDSNITSLRDVSMDFFQKHGSKLSTETAARVRFILEENMRTHELGKALNSGDIGKLRDLFERSFLGARDLYEITNDAMEHMYAAMSTATGVVASRQAGAGFGGCMVSLVYKDQLEEFKKDVFHRYKELSGADCEIYGVHTAKGTHIELI
jgi:galactokinase